MLILVSGGGCKKASSEATQPQSQATNQPSTYNPQPSTTLARVHWLGKKRIAAQKTSTRFMSLWNMPEAARLETQTLDKLALAMIGWSQVTNAALQAPTTNFPSLITNYQALVASLPTAALLRPLLDDLVREESYLEVRQVADQPAEVTLAVRLDGSRADLWTSNFSAVVASIANVQSLPAPASRLAWRLPIPYGPSTLNPQLSTVEMARAGDWTLLGLAAETNGLFADLCHRILLDHTPVAAPGTNTTFQMDPVTRKLHPAPAGQAATNNWLEADLDLRPLSRVLSLGWNLPEGWPRISTTWADNGEFVRTTGELIFPQPLDLQLEPWRIPTNLVHDPLVSFTALRGVRPWLAREKWLQHFQIEPVPNQFCAWATGPAPLLTFAATPMTNAAALLQLFGPRVEADLTPWITNNTLGELEYSKEPVSLAWTGIPMFTPQIEAFTTSEGSFLVGAVGPKPLTTGKPAPPELFAQLMARPSLVYYDWEITSEKLNHWIYLGQTARLALEFQQMEPESAAFAFLLSAAPKLGIAGTEIIQDGPASLGFVRNSQLGFTGVELHWLADWLESPAFPRGLHSLLAPKPVRKRPPHLPGTKPIPSMPTAGQPSTNAVARPR